MIRAIIIDDEQKCVDSLAMDLVQYCSEVKVLAKCQSAKQGLQAIKKWNPELVFLDIEMPWMNGFEMLDILEEINFDIIFTTAYDEYAVKAFRISAVDYLLKPIDKDDLIEAIQKVIDKNGQLPFSKDHLGLLIQNMKPNAPGKRIAIPSSEGYDLILVSDIVYCEADGSYTQVFLNDGKKLFVSRSIKEMDALLMDFNFCRIHHSYTINLDHAVKYFRGDGGYVQMINGKSLNVSRAKKEDLLSRIR